MLRRLILGVSLFFIIIFSSVFIINKIYIKQKCKDLYFATEYLTTRGNLENSLLTIKNFELSFLDKDIAIVEINGLSYDKPHQGGSYAWSQCQIDAVQILHTLYRRDSSLSYMQP